MIEFIYAAVAIGFDTRDPIFFERKHGTFIAIDLVLLVFNIGTAVTGAMSESPASSFLLRFQALSPCLVRSYWHEPPSGDKEYLFDTVVICGWATFLAVTIILVQDKVKSDGADRL